MIKKTFRLFFLELRGEIFVKNRIQIHLMAFQIKNLDFSHEDLAISYTLQKIILEDLIFDLDKNFGRFFSVDLDKNFNRGTYVSTVHYHSPIIYFDFSFLKQE
jgi:hypothetical protein